MIKKKTIAMPMTSAGILGFSLQEDLEGIKIDPKSFVIGVLLLILVIKLLRWAYSMT